MGKRVSSLQVSRSQEREEGTGNNRVQKTVSCNLFPVTCHLFLLLASRFLLIATGLCTAEPRAPIDYLLDLRHTGAHLVLVTMTVPDAGPSLEIQFPAWNALYQMRDFVRNVQDVKAVCDGQPRGLLPVDRNTWRSDGGPCKQLDVSY